MIRRQPELVKYRNGMESGVMNPLGERALYIFKDGFDTGIVFMVPRNSGLSVSPYLPAVSISSITILSIFITVFLSARLLLCCDRQGLLPESANTLNMTDNVSG